MGVAVDRLAHAWAEFVRGYHVTRTPHTIALGTDRYRAVLRELPPTTVPTFQGAVLIEDPLLGRDDVRFLR